jgi:hypothetical protein
MRLCAIGLSGTLFIVLDNNVISSCQSLFLAMVWPEYDKTMITRRKTSAFLMLFFFFKKTKPFEKNSPANKQNPNEAIYKYFSDNNIAPGMIFDTGDKAIKNHPIEKEIKGFFLMLLKNTTARAAKTMIEKMI